MPKFSPKRFINEAKSCVRNSRTPNIAKYTNSRTLQSVYSQLPGAMASQRGASDAAPAKVLDQVVQGTARVWNCNKPKLAKPANKTYNVYAKQQISSSAGKDRSKASSKSWVHPPYPVRRPKEERNRRERQRNYESFYVPFDQDDRSEVDEPMAQSFFVPLDDNRQRTKLDISTESLAIGAKRRSPWTEEDKKFQRLRPAGERFVLKTAEMVSLIAEAKLRQKEAMPLLPPPPQFAEDPKESRKRLLLQRSRTETLFSTLDCDQSLYKYACHLPFVRDPANPDGKRPRLRRFSSKKI
ncbi:uncharacterized protein [Drosophila takahashii]|uniref:uncharacterized protein n=1 Tax=Drosophila takahashii TaxID=29030 RepID=UPI003899549F